jgi:transposase
MAIPPVFDNEVARGEILRPKNISEIDSVPSRHSVLPDGRSFAHEAAQQRMLSGCPLCPHTGWAVGPAHVGSILLSGAKLERIKSYFPLSHVRLNVDDRRVISGVVHVIRNGSRWRDASVVHGPHKTPYNRFLRWSRIGVFWCLRRTSARLRTCATAPKQNNTSLGLGWA